MRLNRSKKGFTLIELLIVVAIIGIIVAIAIPNLLNAIQRAKQKRTMGDMRSIGTAAEAYAVDMNRYPSAAGYSLPSGLTIGTVTINGTGGPLSNVLTPTYIKIIPMKDGWDSWFIYNTGNNSQDYVILSGGKNGAVEVTTTVVGPTTDFNEDIVFVDGQFMQWPDGIQK